MSTNDQEINAEIWANAILYAWIRNKPFRLMALPPEIRLQIYPYLFIANGPIAIPKPLSPAMKTTRNAYAAILKPKHFDVPRGVLMLLIRTNKKLSEVREFIYSKNKFSLPVPGQRHWLTRIGHQNGLWMRSIDIDWLGNESAADNNLSDIMNTMVKWCPQVDHITLRIGWSGHDSRCGPELLLQPHITDLWPGFPKLKDITIEKTSKHRAPATEKSLYDQLAKNSLVTVIATNMTYHRETQGVWYIVEPPRQREKQNKPNRKKPLSQAERVQKKQKREKAETERKAAEPTRRSKEEADRNVALKKFGDGGSSTRHALHWIYKKSEGIVVNESETQDVHDKGKEKKEAVDPKDDSPYAPDYTSEPEDERDATTRKPSTAESPFQELEGLHL